MHFVYILYSDAIDRYYVGETEDPVNRLSQHNISFFKGASTQIAHDWRILLTIKVKNRKEGRAVEKYIKGMKSKQFLKNITTSDIYYSEFKRLVLTKLLIDILDE